MQPLNNSLGWLRRAGAVSAWPRSVEGRIGDWLQQVFGRAAAPVEEKQETSNSLKIARYTLVLMDPDGQVIWSKEWDPGGVFEFRPHQRLSICCGFTNHSPLEAEIAEYEIELMGEDGVVVHRFGDSFGDSLIVAPGQRQAFSAEWSL
jgi:hypothetical protein